MFEKIYDDVYLVKNHNTSTFSIPDSFANDSWLYRQCIGFIFFLTEQINRCSYKYRKIMQTLNTEKKSLLVGLLYYNNLCWQVRIFLSLV